MLTHPTVDKLHQLRCTGMAKALAEQLGSCEVEHLNRPGFPGDYTR